MSEIKTWNKRIEPKNPPYVDPEDIQKAMLEENDELRAHIAALEAQEPVTHEFQADDGTWHGFINQRHHDNTLKEGGWPIRALFLAAGAAPAKEHP